MLITRDKVDHGSFIHRYDAVAFDVDGTLRRSLNPHHPYPLNLSEWAWMPNVLGILQDFYLPTSHLIYSLITNQSGVSKGTLEYATALDLLHELTKEFQGRSVSPFICVHEPWNSCPCRKPSPYFLLRFAMIKNLKVSSLLFVGDMLTDFQAADRAGVDFVWATDFFGW